MDSFISSYLRSIFSNLGNTTFTPTISPTIKTGIAAANMSDKSGLIEIDMHIAKINIIGERTSIRMMI